MRKAGAEALLRTDQLADTRAEEWREVKAARRAERKAFFAEGKQAFKELRAEIFREVREEMRPAWAEYFQARKAGELDGEALRN